MAKSSSNYKILVGIELDTKDIQNQLDKAAKNLKYNLKIDAGSLKEVSSSFDIISKSAKETAGNTDEVNKALKDTAISAKEAELSFQAANEVFQTSIDILGSMVEQVFELDDALTEFRKVSSLSGASLDSYVDQLAELGMEVGRTTSEMVDGATEFRKNGFNDQDAAQLGQVAAMFSNVADEAVSAGESASFIIAQMTAFSDELERFGSEAEKASYIIDVVNELSNQYSVSSADLAENLGNMSAAMAVGNNSMEESISLLVAGTEVTRSASKVSRALVSVQSRFNQVIDESSSTGKALLDWYNKMDIAIFDQQGQLLSLYDVLKQVAEIWPELSKNEQAYYLNQQAGANQTQNLAAILSNYQTAIEATEVALNSTGSASRENEAYMESLTAKVTQLKATFQDLANNVISNDLVKALLNLGNLLLNVINNPVGVTIARAALLTGTFWGLISVLKAMNIISVIGNQFKILTANTTASTAATTANTAATTAATASATANAAATNAMAGAMRNATAAAGGLSLASKALPFVAVASTVISAGISIYEAFTKSEESADDLNDSLDELETTYAQLQSEIAMLNASSETLSEYDQERLESLENQLTLTEKLIDSQKRLRAQELYVADNGEGLKNLEKTHNKIESFIQQLKEYNEALEKGVSSGKIDFESAKEFTKYLDALEGEINESALEFGELIQEINELEDYLDEDFVERWNEEWEELVEYLGLAKENQDKANQSIEEYKLTVEQAQEATSGAIENLVTLESAYDVLNNAVEEYNTYGFITASTLQNLMNLGYDYASALSIQNGQMVLNVRTLQDMEVQLKNTAIRQATAEAAAKLYSIATANATAQTYAASNAMSEAAADGGPLNAIEQACYDAATGAITLESALQMVYEALNPQDNNGFTKSIREQMADVITDLESTINMINSTSYIGSLGSTYRPSTSGTGGTSYSSSSKTDPLQKQNELFKERIEIMEHELFLMEQQGKEDYKRVAQLKQIQATLESQADWFRSKGEGSESEYIRDLQQQWWELQQQIQDVYEEQKERYDASISQLEHELFLLEENGAADYERSAKLLEIQKKIQEQAEKYRSWGMTDESPYIQELQQAWWEVQNQLEEVREEQKERFQESVGQLEHELFLMEKNGKSNEQLIAKLQQLQAALHEQAEKYRSWGMSDNDAYIQELQKQWWEYQDQIDSIYEEIRNSAEEAADAVSEKWEEALQDTIDSLNQQASDYETAFSYIVGLIEEKLDELYEKQDAYETFADYMVSEIDKEIEALEEQREQEEQYWDDKIEALEKQNEELNEQIALEEALDALARARQQKVMVYKDGKFQYVSDPQAVSDAQKEVEDLQREQEYKDAIEALEEQKEQAVAVIDEQIEYWNKYREEWEKLVEDYEKEKDKLLIEQQLGIKLEGQNWKQWVDQYEKYSEEYQDLMDNQIGSLEDYKDKWGSVVEDYKNSQDKLIAEQILGIKLEGDNWMTRLENLDEYIKEYEELMKRLEEAQKTQEDFLQSGGRFWESTSEGKAPEGAQIGDYIITNAGIYKITGGTPGNWESEFITDIIKKNDYSDRKYWKQTPDGKAPPGARVWDYVVTTVGTYQITGGTPGNWTSVMVDPNTNTYNFKGQYANADAYAMGTLSASGGLSLVGENGPEMRVLNPGDGIIPSDITRNLWAWGSMSPAQMISTLGSFGQNNGQITNVTIQNFAPNLSNVTDGQGFADYLSNNFLRQVVQFQSSRK